MKIYRIMKWGPASGIVTYPYYVEECVPGWFDRCKWVRFGQTFFKSVEEAKTFIEQRVVAEKQAQEQARAKPAEIGFGYVANDGKFHWLRDD